MKILFYRYGSICEPDIIECFKAAGIEVYEESSMIMRKNITASETVEQLSALLKSDTYLFVFSINFFPAVSETCNIYNIPYVCWTVDSPIMELFSPSLKNKCNRIFFFDRMQYEYFRQNTEGCCFHLPLATNVSRLDNAILSASTGDQKLYSGDISLVGSLYSEKNPYSKIQGLSEKTKGYIDGILEAQKNVYGYYFVENVLREDIMQEFRVKVPDLTKSPYSQYFDDRYVMAHFFIGMELAERERKEILSALSEKYDTHLYTQSDASMLKSVKVHEGVKTLTQMPLVFNRSKINLNITIRPIQSGLSLRVFDVIGCGGFLMTNYQSELEEYYTPGKEVETYSSVEELIDKCGYYLSHDDERKEIARKGYERTTAQHTYEIRFAQMIKTIYQTL